MEAAKSIPSKSLIKPTQSSIKSMYNLRQMLRTSCPIEIHLKFHIGMCKLSRSTPFSWDCEREKLILQKPWNFTSYPITSKIYAGILLSMLYEILAFAHKNQSHVGNQGFLIRLVFFIVHLVGTLYFALIKNHGYTFVSLVNQTVRLLKVEKRNKGMMIAQTLIMLSTTTMPLMVIMVMFVYPNIPPFPSSLIPEAFIFDAYWVTRSLQLLITMIQVWSFATYCFHGYLIFCGVVLSIGALWTGIRTLKQ